MDERRFDSKKRQGRIGCLVLRTISTQEITTLDQCREILRLGEKRRDAEAVGELIESGESK